MDTNNKPAVGSNDELGPLPIPAGFRSRYRSEPGMIGHYPWTYADARRRKHDRPECEYEDLFTEKQVRLLIAAERERCATICDELEAIWTALKDAAMLNGDVALSNAQSGEPRAARLIKAQILGPNA